MKTKSSSFQFQCISFPLRLPIKTESEDDMLCLYRVSQSLFEVVTTDDTYAVVCGTYTGIVWFRTTCPLVGQCMVP